MKLSDLKRFAVESDRVPGNTPRTATRISVLGEEFHPESGRQSQLSSLTLSGEGKTDQESLTKAIDRTLAFLERVQDKAFAVRGGIVQMNYNKADETYTAKAQLALLDEGDNITHPVIKSMSAFATNKNPNKAEDEALETILKLMGEA